MVVAMGAVCAMSAVVVVMLVDLPHASFPSGQGCSTYCRPSNQVHPASEVACKRNKRCPASLVGLVRSPQAGVARTLSLVMQSKG